jgi:hypothetical protein
VGFRRIGHFVLVLRSSICRAGCKNSFLQNFYDAVDMAAILGESLSTRAWRILKLQMEGRPPDTEGSCEYIE